MGLLLVLGACGSQGESALWWGDDIGLDGTVIGAGTGPNQEVVEAKVIGFGQDVMLCAGVANADEFDGVEGACTPAYNSRQELLATSGNIAAFADVQQVDDSWALLIAVAKSGAEIGVECGTVDMQSTELIDDIAVFFGSASNAGCGASLDLTFTLNGETHDLRTG